MSARFLLIGLDGADGPLIDRWSTDGTLPSLTALRDRGQGLRLSAPAGVTDDGLWASFKYASGLGEHGRYHWIQRSDSGLIRKACLDEVGRDAFWDVLSAWGHRVAVFDVPKCGLPKPLNGLHLTDWLVHGRYFKTPQSHPKGLATEVVAQFGPAPPSRCGYEVGPLSDAEVAEVVGNLQTSVTRKRAAARHYLEADAWDLFVVGFKEAHCAGHHLWDLVDPGHPEHSSAQSARLGDPLRKIYQDLDAAVGELIAAADGADVAVFSTTDMEPNATLSHLMPEVVRRINQVLDDRPLTRALRRIQRASARWPSGWPCELLPYNENCTALRVYTPDSRLRPGTRDGVARETTLDHVESLLRKLTDVDTGDPVVASIERPSAELSGERSAALPDLLVRYEPGTFPRAVVSPRLGRVEAERPPLRPGDHAAGGFLIASGRFGAGVSGMEDLGVMAASVLGVPVAQTPGRAGGPDPEASSIANAAEAVSRGSRPRRTAASPR